MGLSVRPMSETFAAEIEGVDLTAPLSGAAFARIRDAFHRYGVLVFRGQALSAEQHIAFSRRFGELEIHVLKQYLLPGHDEILVLSNVTDGRHPKGVVNAGRFWHSDLSYMERPSLGSLLYAVSVPPQGGDTLYADLCAAYQALPGETKRRIAGLKAVHRYAQRYNTLKVGGKRVDLTEEQLARVPEVAQPLVRTHPDTGRKVLYMSNGFMFAIAGMSEEEGGALLQELSAHATRPEFVYRHAWQADDLVLWDNRCTMHCATPFDESHARIMHRTTIGGDRPF